MELARHLRRIRVPVRLGVDSFGPGVAGPPDALARRAIEHAVRDWLVSGKAETARFLDVEGLRFWIAGPALEERTELAPVRTGSAANRDLVLAAIAQKVKRYRRLVDELDLPLMVVLSTDRETDLGRSHFDRIMAGKNSVSVSIPHFGVGAIETGSVTLLQDETAPTFDEALSAVAWLEVRDGVHAELSDFWPSPAAKHPVARLDEAVVAGPNGPSAT